jgi:hypothetical protein
MMRGIRLSMPEVDPVLDRDERSLIERALAHLRESAPRDSSQLWAHVKRCAMIAEIVDQTPSLRYPTVFGGHVRDEASLVAELSRLDPMDGELPLPERAQVARGFLLEKISLLRAFATALATDAPGHDPVLQREVRGELAQSIYTLIAAEILVGILCDSRVLLPTKARAARQLILIWDRAVDLEIDDFCPLLELAWQAHSRVGVRFGALMGAGEFLRLANEDCPQEFLDFFVRDDVSDGELEAFDEFLFNLPHEDLVRLRAAMRAEGRAVVDLAACERMLGRPLSESSAVDDPEALYRSYRRRRTAAEFRRMTGAPGPLRTAEAYLMIYVLDSKAGQTGQWTIVSDPR